MPFIDWLKQPGNIAIAAALIGAVAGAIFTKFLPFLTDIISSLGVAVARHIGGRFARLTFQKVYLNWLVTELRELKLTGIVSYDEVKKPQLEQVFVSLRVADEREPVADLLSLVNAIRTHNWASAAKLIEQVPLTEADVRARILSVLTAEIIGIEAQVPNRSALFSIAAKALGICTFLPMLQRWSINGPAVDNSDWPNAIRHCTAGRSLRSRVRQLGNRNTEAPELARLLNEFSRIAILGVPGSGKTTILQYVALTYARVKTGDSRLRQRRALKKRFGVSEWRLPVYFPLSTVSGALMELRRGGADPSILEALPKILPPDFQRGFGARTADFFQAALESGNCVVLLDGLDEVPTEEEYKVVVRSIESLAVTFPKNQYIVTSRIAGWRTGIGADFRVLYVADFSERQVEKFIDLWYDAVELNAVVGRLADEGPTQRAARIRRSAQRGRELKKALRDNSSVRLLATNPMLLSIIALVHRSLVLLC
jgi:hypothetical protein